MQIPKNMTKPVSAHNIWNKWDTKILIGFPIVYPWRQLVVSHQKINPEEAKKFSLINWWYWLSWILLCLVEVCLSFCNIAINRHNKPSRSNRSSLEIRYLLMCNKFTLHIARTQFPGADLALEFRCSKISKTGTWEARKFWKSKTPWNGLKRTQNNKLVFQRF